jgi:fructose-1,6-bisphosphatase/inositol monophosphatase family enzyme
VLVKENAFLLETARRALEAMRVATELIEESVRREIERGAAGQWGLSGLKPSQYAHDVRADDAAIPYLHNFGYNVLSEESGFHSGPRDVVIIVDPIDGSTNLGRGLSWATSMAAYHPEHGVIAALCAHNIERTPRGVYFSAIKGEGASRNGVSLQRSSVTRLDRAMLAVSDPVRGGWVGAMQTRSIGAGVLEMILTTTDTFDAYANFGVGHNVWDFLGAKLICEEAGMIVTELDGREIDPLDPDARHAFAIAPTAELSAELVTKLRALRAHSHAPEWGYEDGLRANGTPHVDPRIGSESGHQFGRLAADCVDVRIAADLGRIGIDPSGNAEAFTPTHAPFVRDGVGALHLGPVSGELER